MARAVVHFEIIGKNPAALRTFYAELFGWEYNVGDASSDLVSDPGQYGFIDGASTENPSPINGGIGGGPGHSPHVIFYVGVPDVEQTLRDAERLGGKRLLESTANGPIAVGHFSDPEGNVVGIAGPIRPEAR
ncbi:VOC family protein [Cryptosporangium phraense]|uniref:Glyoxalase n=1 Tax=Cryptosporangium phraense TaxID=2593070 RepID=A0A545B182_9ACTN|nr:VOC family protein [Cryptosporangium phraense]TQS46595.1 glyoxalase [Cryptosporangium phraense]